MQAETQKNAVFDMWLMVALLVLLTLGLVLVYSSSAVYAGRIFHDAERFLKMQLLWMMCGFLAMLIAFHIPRKFLFERCGWLGVVALGLCSAVLVPGVGRLVGGGRRWLSIGALSCQPSEAAKLALVIFLSAMLARRMPRDGGTHRGLFLPVLLTQLPIALVLCEPDMGSAMVMEAIMIFLVFAAGLRLRTLLVLGVCSIPVVYQLVFATPFRMRRLLSYIDPWAYRSTVGYQITEALISIGSGGLFGVGLGEGKQKLFFLPEAHTDFIFAILAEELGLIGVLVLLMAFAVLIWRGIALAMQTKHRFDRYLALGITLMIAIPAVFNACVVTGLLPTKGLPLPFVSYGGSNLVVLMASLGLLMRIRKDCQQVDVAICDS